VTTIPIITSAGNITEEEFQKHSVKLNMLQPILNTISVFHYDCE